MRSPQVDQDLRDVDLHRADLVARAAQRRGVRQRARVLHRLQLRRQDGADRPAVDRAVGVPAGLPVDRARVQARARSGCNRASRATLRRPALWSARCRAARRETRSGPSPGVTPVQIELYGFIRSPVADRGSNCRNTSRSWKRGMTFSMPTSVISSARQRHAHAAVALGLDDAHRAGFGDREVRAAEADLARAGTSRAGTGAPPQRAPRADRSARSSCHRGAEDVADLGAVEMQRRNDDVRRPVLAELDDQIGEIGLVRREACAVRALRSAAVSSEVIVLTLMISELAVPPG